MKDIRTNKLLEAVKNGEPLGLIHNDSLIYLSYDFIMGAKVWYLIIDDIQTDEPEDEKIELGRTSKGVNEEGAKVIAKDILKGKGIQYDIEHMAFNFSGRI